MTVRQEIATAAMVALVTADPTRHQDIVAEEAVNHADSLIRALGPDTNGGRWSKVEHSPHMIGFYRECHSTQAKDEHGHCFACGSEMLQEDQ